MDIGDRIRARARELGLSDSELARRLDVDPSRVGRYVRGVNEPDLGTLLRLCSILECTPNDLLLPRRAQDDEHDRVFQLLANASAALPVEDLKIVANLAIVLKGRSGER